MRRSAVRFATLTSEDSGFTLSFSRYSYVFVLIEFYIKFEPKVSSIFFFSKTSREKSRLFSFSFLFLRRFFPYVTLFLNRFARAISVCTDDYAVSITRKTIDSNARDTFIQVYSKIFREYESREGTFDLTSSSRFE